MTAHDESEQPCSSGSDSEDEVLAIRCSLERIVEDKLFATILMKDGMAIHFYPLSFSTDSSLGWQMDVVIGIIQNDDGDAEGWKGIPLFLIDRVSPHDSVGNFAGG